MADLPVQLTRALEQRKSVRGFHPEPLPEAELRHLFAMAQRAPSWCNVQPWRVWVTAPPVTRQVAEALTQAAMSGLPDPDLDFPHSYPEPYLARRRACGNALYSAMGIEREDKVRRQGAWLRNFALFDAPHLAVITQERELGQYGTLDVGLWLGFLLASAAALSIDACPMASVAAYPEPLRRVLGIPAELAVLCGVVLGHEDPEVAANGCRTDREPLDANVTLVGF